MLYKFDGYAYIVRSLGFITKLIASVIKNLAFKGIGEFPARDILQFDESHHMMEI